MKPINLVLHLPYMIRRVLTIRCLLVKHRGVRQQ